MENERVRTGVGFDKARLDRAKKFAGKNFGGNVSALIESALDHYMGNGLDLPESEASECLMDLCRNFCPTFLPEMRKACEGLDQPKALASLLMLFATGNSGLSKEFLKVAEAHSVYNKKESK